MKARQQGTWSSGDYSAIGTTLQSTGESLAEAVDIGAVSWSSTSPPGTAMPLSLRRGEEAS